jgi:hypothetical protein
MPWLVQPQRFRSWDRLDLDSNGLEQPAKLGVVQVFE